MAPFEYCAECLFVQFNLGNPSMFDFDWQPFSINRDNFARISSSSSPSLPESIDGYHNSAINFWSGGIDGIIRNRTLIKNETMVFHANKGLFLEQYYMLP